MIVRCELRSSEDGLSHVLTLKAKSSELLLFCLFLSLLNGLLLLVDFKHLLQGCWLVRLGYFVVFIKVLLFIK